tara:strand:- start:782 stop:1153 length:372 start_codon:yes stop_codon:yes gene_type:complete
MAHYAKVLSGKVINVIVAEQDFIDNLVDETPGKWIQTSYNTRGGKHYKEDGTESSDQSKALRKNYANLGGVYNKLKDAFYEEQPFPSWTLNDTTCLWECPVEYPSDGKIYNWNEEDQSWDAVK